MRYLIIILIVFIFSKPSYSSHAAGGYISYTCLGNDVYAVNFTLIRDCDGIDESNTETLFYSSTSAGFNNSITLTNNSCNTIQYCPQIDLSCGNEAFSTYEKCTYTGVLTLPDQADDWILSVEIANRNNFDYVNEPAGAILRLEAGIINTNGSCNSSPIPTDKEIIQGCTASDPIVFESTLIDPDGDNLTMIQTPLLGAGGTAVGYSAGAIDHFVPYPVNGSYSFNNGIISFTTNTTGTSAQSILIREFDQNGQLVGWFKRELPITITNNCVINPPEASFFQSNNSTLDISGQTDVCFNIFVSKPLYSTIDGVQISGLNGATVSNTTNIGIGTVFEICWESPVSCNEQNFPFSVTASVSSDCSSSLSKTFNFELFKDKAEFCPEFQYVTNLNPQSNNVLLSYYRAQQKIWVGDDMPASYNPILGPVGNVIADNDVVFEAGQEVVLPSCQGGGASCVTLNGDVTIRLEPLDCGSGCDLSDIEACTDEVFACNNERIKLEINGGNPPFNVLTYLNGDLISNTVTPYNYVNGSPFFINISDHIKQHNGYQDYTVVVTNGAGEDAVINGSVLGTKRFYEPIENNMLPNQFGEMKYAVQFRVTPSFPAFVYDDVNFSPPFYGATYMDLLLVHQWGDEVLFKTVNLENSTRWSIDNGEMFYNGHKNNNLNNSCLGGGTGGGIFPALLRARNCATPIDLYYHDDFNELQGDPSDPEAEESIFDSPYDLEAPNFFGPGNHVRAPNGFFWVENSSDCYDGPTDFEAVGFDSNFDPFYFEYVTVGNYFPFCQNFSLGGNTAGMIKDSSFSATDNQTINLIQSNNNMNYNGVNYMVDRRNIAQNKERVYKKLVLNVYPNPFTDYINIDGDIENIKHVNLMDISGKIISSHKPTNRYNFINLSVGVYLLEIVMNNDKTEFFKITKM